MVNSCKVKIGNDVLEGTFLELFQYSDVLPPSPMIGGHPGGVVAYPVAVVRVGNELKQVKLKDITFNSYVKLYADGHEYIIVSEE